MNWKKMAEPNIVIPEEASAVAVAECV